MATPYERLRDAVLAAHPDLLKHADPDESMELHELRMVLYDPAIKGNNALTPATHNGPFAPRARA